jgi:hypothetical protein
MALFGRDIYTLVTEYTLKKIGEIFHEIKYFLSLRRAGKKGIFHNIVRETEGTQF